MPQRSIAAKELGSLLGVLAHPRRLQIIEELRAGELDVNALQARLAIAHSGVSQHLALLRAHRLVAERREGRHVHYRLSQPELADWLLEGFRFLEAAQGASSELLEAIEHARAAWSVGESR